MSYRKQSTLSPVTRQNPNTLLPDELERALPRPGTFLSPDLDPGHCGADAFRVGSWLSEHVEALQ